MGTILINEPLHYDEKALAIYALCGNVIRNGMESYSPNDVTTLVVRLGQYCGPDFLRKFPQLKYIVSPATGLNHLDLFYCKQNHIKLLTLKDYPEYLKTITATSEHTMGLILSMVRKIHLAHQETVKKGNWDRDTFCGRTLNGMVLGIIGLGRLGRQVTRLAQAFGMRVLTHDPYISEDDLMKLQKDLLVEHRSLEEVLSMSDIISLHVDLNESSLGLLNKERMLLMKKGSYLVNTSRGEVIVENDLVDLLSSKHLAAAALDVLAKETERREWDEDPILNYAAKNDNLLITPHIGGATHESMRATEVFMATEYLKLFNCEKGKKNEYLHRTLC